jgi:malate dehydrogenase
MRHTVAVVGAGELGAAVARRLAEGERARRVLLLDADEGRARGKALDILQAAPVMGFDTWVEGAAADAIPPVDAVVLADPDALAPGRLPSEAAALLERVRPALAGGGPLVVAGVHPEVVEAAVRLGIAPREGVVGSAPVALAAALRRRVALHAGARASDLSLVVLGRPPAALVAPAAGSSFAGLPLDRLAPAARRRALADLRGRGPGPFALAAAATRVLRALDGADPVLLSVFVVLQGEYGHRGRAVAVPARLGAGRILSVVEGDLDPVDRVAFDNAAGRP